MRKMKKCLPFASRESWRGRPDQNYAATAGWSAGLTFLGMAIFLGVVGLQKAHDEEKAKYDHLDDSLHRFAAFITIAAINLTFAGIPALLHFRKTSREVEKAAERARLLEPGGRFGSRAKKDIPCPFPLRACFPPTPLKTFLWFLSINATTTLITLAVHPDKLQDLFKSEFAHYGAVVTGATLAAAAVSSTCTLFHCVGAKTRAACDERRNAEVYDSFYTGADV